ncbi:MAG TPA: hypothetical protein IAA48_00575 [Candidatus Eubacterium faecipullorum]|uniref:Penicillin-binding protein n=1 Tax=Candidatus Eubacterium faecipullorum TaxID=2838571 RepID=A0A9D1RAX5_9FIRM|nr:hypothetical protein [Candidatus Eubacterium faecipullorum]
MRSRHFSLRSLTAIILVIALVCTFGYTLYDIQIVNGEYYRAQNSTLSTYTVTIEAARGEIVDRNGNPLVTNRQGNSIILDAAYFPSSEENDERNAIIMNLIELFEANGEEYVNNLPLVQSADGIAFTEDEDAVATMKSEDMFNLQSYATAQNCFDAMVEKYGLEGYDTATALKIGSIRYELTRLLFSIENPVTIADDVSDETVAAIKEDQQTYLGADVLAVAYREYADSTLAPHILGTVRKINAEEYAELRDEGYGINDTIGESGIEAAMESELRGTPGELTITIDADGNVTEEITKEPIQGNTVVLTIDRDLQRIAQQQLEITCNEVSASQSAGAVVVEDVNTGAILAAASYPTYDLQDYYDSYSSLASNSRQPLFNRFALGTYAPGSTFKPAMACAALEEGVIDESTTFRCGGVWQYYDVTFRCLNSRAHGSENVREALRDSCNIFFYNCADRLGISKMNEYASMFGLGEKTGVEISEAAGVLAGPASAERYNRVWQMGDTIQSGIGQSDNLFTPLQLANYCATVANGGTKYEMHFVQSVINTSSGTIEETGAAVAQELPISDNTFNIVHEGMRMVAQQYTLSNIFSDSGVDVACKTGTSQVIRNGEEANNGFLITFAPYENPEISIASAIELAGSGTSTAEITASIIEYYYSNNTDEQPAQNTGTLLN